MMIRIIRVLFPTTLICIISPTIGTSADFPPAATIKLPKGDGPCQLRFTPDGKSLFGCGTDESDRGVIHCWDFETGTIRLTNRDVKHAISASSIDTIGKQLLAIGEDGRLRLFGGAKWDIQAEFDNEPNRFPSQTLALSPNGRSFLVGNDRKGPRLWNSEKKTSIPIEARKDTVIAVAFAPNGTEFAIAYSGTTIDLFETATAKRFETLSRNGGAFLSATYSPDGKVLATGWCHPRRLGRDDFVTMLLWDTKTRKLLHECSGTYHTEREPLFTPDSKYIIQFLAAAPQKSQRVDVWEVATGRLVIEFETGKPGWGIGCAISPNGRWLLTGANDGMIQKWDFTAIRKEFEAKLEKDKK